MQGLALLVAMLVYAVPLYAQAVPTSPQTRIPAFNGAALSGDSVVLPDALRGKIGVLVVGFSTGSRDAVTAWSKLLAGDYRDASSVLYYEMPVIASVPRILRGFVAGRIKDSVPPLAQARCVLVEADEAKWKQAMGFAGADDAYVAITDGTGIIRWRTQGSPNNNTYAILRQQIEALQTSH